MKHLCGSKCAFIDPKDELKLDQESEYNCESCGFNPEEKKRRLSEGRTKNDGFVAINHKALNDGREGIELITDLQTLRFPKRMVET